MREIAREAGFANGALAPYFPNKNAIVESAFRDALLGRDERMTTATVDRTGLDAVWHTLLEMLPLDDDRLVQARVLIPFWEEALTDASYRDLLARMAVVCREKFAMHVREAQAAGEVDVNDDPVRVADTIYVFAMGLQSQAVLDATYFSTHRMSEHAESFFDHLRLKASTPLSPPR